MDRGGGWGGANCKIYIKERRERDQREGVEKERNEENLLVPKRGEGPRPIGEGGGKLVGRLDGPRNSGFLGGPIHRSRLSTGGGG